MEVQVLSGSNECLSWIDREVTSSRCQLGLSPERLEVWDRGNFVITHRRCQAKDAVQEDLMTMQSTDALHILF